MPPPPPATAAAAAYPLLNATNLRAAVRDGNMTVVSELASPTTVNSVDVRGWTPLMIAAERDDAPVITLLIRRGADVMRLGPTTNDMVAAPHLAALATSVPALSAMFLVRKHSYVNVRSGILGATPLRVAASTTTDNLLATLLQLLDTGADINAADVRGDTALHAVCLGRAKSAPQAAFMLAARGADAYAVNRMGVTPIMEAQTAVLLSLGLDTTTMALPTAPARGQPAMGLYLFELLKLVQPMEQPLAGGAVASRVGEAP